MTDVADMRRMGRKGAVDVAGIGSVVVIVVSAAILYKARYQAPEDVLLCGA